MRGVPYCQRCGKEWIDGGSVEKEAGGSTRYRCACGAYYVYFHKTGKLAQPVGDRVSTVTIERSTL
jgi:Zn-finger nucleic acid-binding protein